MSYFRQPPNASDTFRICPATAPAKLRKPLHYWRAAVLILIKKDLSWWYALYLCL
jgi:hypothetical protein